MTRLSCRNGSGARHPGITQFFLPNNGIFGTRCEAICLLSVSTHTLYFASGLLLCTKPTWLSAGVEGEAEDGGGE